MAPKLQKSTFFGPNFSIKSGFCDEPKIANIFQCALLTLILFAQFELINTAQEAPIRGASRPGSSKRLRKSNMCGTGTKVNIGHQNPTRPAAAEPQRAALVVAATNFANMLESCLLLYFHIGIMRGD